jgi:hypothetical protein
MRKNSLKNMHSIVVDIVFKILHFVETVLDDASVLYALFFLNGYASWLSRLAAECSQDL